MAQNNSMSADQWTKTYTSFGGSDIVATFNGKVIGELQAITYSITREKVPVYTMGSAEPRSFSRGKRGIAGNLVFVSFNRDALMAELSENTKVQKYYANDRDYLREQFGTNFVSIEDWDKAMTNLANSGQADDNNQVGNVMDLINEQAKPNYSDELYPFDITITLANEYGAKASEVLYGVELLNEGTGYSVDAPTSERAYTFICRSVDTMRPISEDSKGFITTTW